MKLPLYLSREEVEFLMNMLKGRADPLKINSALFNMHQKLVDEEDRLREISARCRTNQYWERDPYEEQQASIDKRREKREAKRQQIIKGINELPLDQKEEILRCLRGKV